MINLELKKYIESNVLVGYVDNFAGHGIEHVQFVIDRSFELVKEFHLDVDLDMVYVIAAYHDLGYSREPDDHEMISSKMFQKDEKMKDFFGEEQRNIIAEAILDHRASLEYEPRSIYGKIVSSADREVLVSNMLRRSILFQREKHKSENLSWEQIMDYSYKKLSSKYGKGGYAKMYFPDEKYLSYIKRMQELLENKEDFF